METLLYSYGSDSCFEELNLYESEQIHKIHCAYIDAGSDIIQTNTYAGNYSKLERYGLQDQIKQINRSAVRLARKAVDNQAYVVGTIGGIRDIQPHTITIEKIKRSIQEQLYCLLLECRKNRKLSLS